MEPGIENEQGVALGRTQSEHRGSIASEVNSIVGSSSVTAAMALSITRRTRNHPAGTRRR